MQRMIRELNGIYRRTKALFQVDFEQRGFEWIDIHDRDNSIFAWLRRAADAQFVVCIVNLTPVVRYDYRVGVPQGGLYQEIFNSDASEYGGSGLINAGSLTTEQHSAQGRPESLRLNLPPLATIILAPA
jgi:1,4-alpha-glucan branching enzyme